jgi:hypothetical protein
MEVERGRVQFREETPDVIQVDALAVQEHKQRILLRYAIVAVVLALYSVTLLGTLALLYLAGLGHVSFSEKVLLSVVAVFAGELGVGAILMQIVKNLFSSS